MTKKKTYMIRNEIGKFWTGHGWSDEYPDGLICEGLRELKEQESKAQRKAVRLQLFNVED